MKLEIKEKWVAALRSGEYKQGTGQLRYQDNYCCLGVLCDLYKKEHSEAEWVKRENAINLDDYAFHDGFSSDNAVLTSDVLNWAGLQSFNPRIIDDKTVAQLNDNGETFAKIADLIEKEL